MSSQSFAIVKHMGQVTNGKGIYDANIFASAFDFVEPEFRGSVASPSIRLDGLTVGGE